MDRNYSKSFNLILIKLVYLFQSTYESVRQIISVVTTTLNVFKSTSGAITELTVQTPAMKKNALAGTDLM